MNRTGNQLFTGSSLTLDENRGIPWERLWKLPSIPCAATSEEPDDFFEHGRVNDLFAQRDGFVAHTIFGTFTIINVRTGRIPSK